MCIDSVLMICLLSNKSAIGDGFLDFVSDIPPEARGRCIVVKTNAYSQDLFPDGIGKFVDLRLSRHDISFSAILDFVCVIVRLSKLSRNSRIFVYGVSPLNHILALLLPSKIKNIWIHDPDLHPGAKIAERFAWILIKLISVFLKNVRVFVSAEYLADRVRHNFLISSDDINVIPFPYLRSIVEDNFDNAQSSFSSGTSQILFFGRVEPYKGVDILIRNTYALFIEGLKFKLRISGKGELGDVKKYAYITHDNFYVPDRELQTTILDSVVCVFPYTSATGTQALQSALALGVPCIVSDIPAFRYIAQQVHNEGVYFVHSEEELKNIIRDFLLGRVIVNRQRIRDIARVAFCPYAFSHKLFNLL